MMSFGLSTELPLPNGQSLGGSDWFRVLRSRQLTQVLSRAAASMAYLLIMFAAVAMSGALGQGATQRQVGPQVDISGWANNPSLLQPVKSTPAKADNTPAPAPVVTPPPCIMPQTENTVLFAECANMAIDFTVMPNGPFNSKYFNTYIGAPDVSDQAQYYSGNIQNIRIENGALLLQAHNNPKNGFDYTSARIDTKGKYGFQYGKLRVRAMMPKGHGAWPAIWMLSNDLKHADKTYFGDPKRYLYDGEIDIAELIGSDVHTVYGVAHALNHYNNSSLVDYYGTTKVWDSERAFHDYGVDWTPTSITYSVDERPFFTFTKQPGDDWQSWPYDQRYYLIINLALGGGWAGSNRTQFPKDGVDPAIFPTALQIQSIRYYQYIGTR